MDNMPYWVVRLEWSQTDWDHVIVQAISKDAAKAKILGNPRYIVVLYGPIEKIIS